MNQRSRFTDTHTLMACGCLPAADGSAIGGTYDFMPPEQLVRQMYPEFAWPRHHQGQADVYSVGVCLWSLLIGQYPFDRNLVTGSQQDRSLNSLLDVKTQLVSTHASAS